MKGVQVENDVEIQGPIVSDGLKKEALDRVCKEIEKAVLNCLKVEKIEDFEGNLFERVSVAEFSGGEKRVYFDGVAILEFGKLRFFESRTEEGFKIRMQQDIKRFYEGE